ncbi:universal stress protein [Stenomitos frigidus]|uniref:Universal stress protein n=1 Tax=Stenomitos frigidus ULC18 TaxID=2107698 RepID=A0A2T1E6U4_9CYAN|nr:universal stress protein [Stenomitos frigidus]PSB28448.1 universal stress protein [Stenomitos frigidus ULC18]
MFHKILVAVDSSNSGKKVFEEALALAKATKATLMLLHVLSGEEVGSPKYPALTTLEYYPTLDGSMLDIYREQWQHYEKQGLERLRSLTQTATDAGVPTEFTQNLGSPGPVICQLARNLDVDLVMLGRRGHSGLSELLLGSVSNYVLHHAPCSVLTVQGETHADADAAMAKQASIAS